MSKEIGKPLSAKQRVDVTVRLSTEEIMSLLVNHAINLQPFEEGSVWGGHVEFRVNTDAADYREGIVANVYVWKRAKEIDTSCKKE